MEGLPSEGEQRAAARRHRGDPQAGKMPLEAVMVCVDNSDYTRNGDYAPTRFVSQTDAVQLVCSSKTLMNPENSVGILTTAGDRIEVLITPTSDLGRMVAEIANVKIGGHSDLLRGIQTAQLALKHRQNKNQKQRIVAFVGSPVTASEKELETLGKNLKKNNVSLDLVSFGEVDENTPKLDKLLQAVNSNETSHVLSVPVGPKLLSDVLLSSPILSEGGEGAAAAAAAGGGDGGYEFGINPNDDPELALALRISMEEERARQQAAEGGAPPADGAPAPAAPTAGAAGEAPAATGAAAGGGAAPIASDADVLGAMGEDMDEELRQALLLSMQEPGAMDTTEAPAPAPAPTAATPAAATGAATGGAAPAPPAASDAELLGAMSEDMDEELRQALLLSMQAETQGQQMDTSGGGAAAPPAAAAPTPAAAGSTAAAPPEKPDVEMEAAPATASTAAAPAPAAAGGGGDATMADASTVDARWFQDPEFVSELLGSLPGVNMEDQRIKDAINEVTGGEKKDGEGGGGGGGSSSGGGGASGGESK